MNNEIRYNTELKAYVFIFLASLMFAILLYGYYQLQIVNNQKYLSTSSKNIVRQRTIFPIRGDILARDSSLIVDNRPAFSLYVSPRILKKDSSSLIKLRKIIQDSTVNYKRIYKRRYASSERVLLKRHIDQKLMSKLIENRPFLNGVFIENDSRRNHIGEISGTHIIGYVSEINDRDLKKNKQFLAGDMIGKSGIERFYNRELYGKKGKVSQVFDALGNQVRNLAKEMELSIPEEDGKDLYTTIDTKLQFVAESLLVKQVGSIVVMDTRNGGILAMASSPSYKADLMTKPISDKVWNELIDPKNRNPLLNRSIQGRYPPGSTYKMVAALAALKEGLVSPSWKVLCEGALQIGNKTIRCWNHKGHGEVNLRQAIRSSCNIYFYNLGLKIGLEKWEYYSKAFGFGSKTNIDIPREKKGLVPSVAYYQKRYPGGHKAGHLAILAIGQGELLVTPLQMAQFMTIIANEGDYYDAHFLKGFSPKYKREITPYRLRKKRIPVDFAKRHWKIVKQGMKDAVNSKYGATAWRTKLSDIVIAGKTGTAQVPPKRAHSWFTGFAPFEKSEIAVAVLIENGGSGGGVATRAARALFQQYFYGRVIPIVFKKKEDVNIDIEIPDLVVPTIIETIDIERED